MKTLLFLLAFLPMLAVGQPSRNLYFDPVSHIITEDTTTNPVCLERGHVWKITQLKATKDCQPYIVDNLYYTIKVYPACDLTRSDCMRCGVRQKSTATDWVDTIWRKPGIKRTIKRDTLVEEIIDTMQGRSIKCYGGIKIGGTVKNLQNKEK